MEAWNYGLPRSVLNQNLMPGLDIKIEGLDKLQKNFVKRGKNIKPTLDDIIKKSIHTVERYEVIETSTFKRPTGRLANSIAQGKEFRDLYGSVGPTVYYAKFVNYGTRYITPNPFIQRGATAARPDISKIAKQEIKKAMDT